MNIKKFKILVLLFISFFISSVAFSSRIEEMKYVPGEVIVKFRGYTPKTSVLSFSKNLGFTIKDSLKIKGKESNTYLMKLPSGKSVEEAINQIKGRPDIEYIEPNYLYHLSSTMPNDTSFNLQWYLNNTGQDVNGIIGTSDADIDAPEAWDITTGNSDVVVAVIDSGVDLEHPDLKDNIWTNPGEIPDNGIDDDNNGYIDDIHGWDFIDNDNEPNDFYGHGTHVAGIIGAKGNNGQFISGVNWQVQIMPLRCGGIASGPKEEGVTPWVTSFGTAAAIHYAVDNGASIINASYGGPKFSQTQYDAWKYASDNNVLCVIAAGNESNNDDVNYVYPADFGYEPACNGNPAIPNIISVAATNENDQMAVYSNYGLNSVDVAAPGGSWHDLNNNGLVEADRETNIFSTVPEITADTPLVIFNEDFTPRYNWYQWGTNSTWALDATGGDTCLVDSFQSNYVNNTDSYCCYADPIIPEKESKYVLSCDIKYDLYYDFAIPSMDALFIVASFNGSDWLPVEGEFWIDGIYYPQINPLISPYAGVTGTSQGKWLIWNNIDLTYLADLLDKFYIGFNLKTDTAYVADGVYIDNVELKRIPLSVSDHGDTYLSGTSMAAPVVSGIAALVKSMRPWLTAAKIKDIILDTVDEKDFGDSPILTNGRVNAYKAVTYNTPPYKPANNSPSNNASNVSITPTLSASSFSDPEGDEHESTQWQITTVSGNYSNPIWDYETNNPAEFTSVKVPGGILNYDTTYYWHVRYKDNYLGSKWSDYSDESSFTTESAPTEDTDHDGLPDSWEMQYFGNLNYGPNDDPDNDGLTNLQEYNLSTNPANQDTDGDGLPDGWEVQYSLDPTDSTGNNGANGDPDNDGYTNLQEYQGGSNPMDENSTPSTGWYVPLNIELNGSSYSTLVFGMQEGATDNFDTDIDQIAPPASPDGDDAYFSSITGEASPYNHLIMDKRGITDNLTIWRLEVKVASGKSMRIIWDSEGLPEGINSLTWQEADENWNGVGDVNNMSDTGEIDITNNTGNLLTKRYLIRASSTTLFNLHLEARGWNLISLPINPVNPNPEEVFGDKLIAIWRWDAERQRYVRPEEIKAKEGYWIAVSESVDLEIEGTAPESTSVHLLHGWNLIGPVGNQDIPAESFVIAVWGWDWPPNYRYIRPETCEEGKGYWVAVTQEGEIW